MYLLGLEKSRPLSERVGFRGLVWDFLQIRSQLRLRKGPHGR